MSVPSPVSAGRAGEVWGITGVPGSGKSTVARELAFAVPRGIAIGVDTLRWMVGSGYVSARRGNGEGRAQLRLERRSAATMVTIYAESGFLVLIDDVIMRRMTRSGRRDQGARRPPTLEEVLARNATRDRPIDPTPARGWDVVDATDEAPRRTALRLLGDAV